MVKRKMGKMSGRKMSKREWHEWHEWHEHKGGLWFGIFLVLVGLLWLAKDLGYIPSVPFWPLVVILLGLFIVAKKYSKR